MSTIRIQQALQEINKINAANNRIAALLNQAYHNESPIHIINGHHNSINENNQKIIDIRNSVGLFYAVWQCNFNGQTYQPMNVVSPTFEDKAEAENFLTINLKSKQILGKITYQIFNTTIGDNNTFIGHF